MRLVKLLAVNIVVIFIIYSGVAAVFYLLRSDLELSGSMSGNKYNSNTIRATYPNYAGFDKETAMAIFEEYRAPKTSYRPFIGYRRNEFKGEVVNIDSEFGFRLSHNHTLNESIWFFGGSTMWGTGATDMTTIPSFFSKLTDEDVLNLGESGFTSFQELIQLQIMLANGHLPRRVIFYDGFNDGYFGCQSDEPVPTHSYRSRFKKIIDEHADLEKSASMNVKVVLQNAKLSDILRIKWGGIGVAVYQFYYSPVAYLMPKSKVGGKERYSNDRPYSEFRANESYLQCQNYEVAQRAAKVMIRAWLNAYVLLAKYGVPVTFILQPTAVYRPSEYELDYLINLRKQDIANEEKSFDGFYNAVRNEWERECSKYAACDTFIDMSDLFFGINEPVFIDTCHVGPAGNKMVAKAIVEKVF
jgi:hypothetical protein